MRHANLIADRKGSENIGNEEKGQTGSERPRKEKGEAERERRNEEIKQCENGVEKEKEEK